MAERAYLTISGQKQGNMKGSVTVKGHAGKIEVTAWTFGGELGGGNSGASSAGNFFLAKTVDSSSPQLFEMLFALEPVSSFLLEALGVDQKTGALTVEQSWKLTGARMASIRQSGAGGGSTVPDQEELTFAFSEATYTDLPSGTSRTFAGSLSGTS